MAISKKMSKIDEKCKKMRVPFGSLPDTILETILEAFGVSWAPSGVAELWSGAKRKKWRSRWPRYVKNAIFDVAYNLASIVYRCLTDCMQSLEPFLKVCCGICAMHFCIQF